MGVCTATWAIPTRRTHITTPRLCGRQVEITLDEALRNILCRILNQGVRQGLEQTLFRCSLYLYLHIAYTQGTHNTSGHNHLLCHVFPHYITYWL